MASVQSFLIGANDMARKKIYVEPLGEKPDVESKADRRSEMKYSAQPRKKKTAPSMAKCNSYYLLADFGVPWLQRVAIEAKEGAKTIGGVVKDIATKETYKNPHKNSMWTGNLKQGFSEARNRVKSSLRKANDANIEKELMKNKALDLQVDKMRQAAKKKYAAGGVKELAPLTRQEPDGILALNKSYNVGKKAKK